MLGVGVVAIALTGVIFNQSRKEIARVFHLPPIGRDLKNYDKPLTQMIGVSPIDKNRISLLVEKSKYRLTVYYGERAVKSYPIVLGGNPTDDKRQEGDSCTPEGRFRIIKAYPHDRWSKFLWLNYPTRDSWAKHNKAKLAGKISQEASIGSEIGIHGVPSGCDNYITTGMNWTAGCISLKIKDIDEIYTVVQAGSDVEIVR